MEIGLTKRAKVTSSKNQLTRKANDMGGLLYDKQWALVAVVISYNIRYH